MSETLDTFDASETFTPSNTPSDIHRSNARIIKCLVEMGGDDWFIGMMLGTDEYLTKKEKNKLTTACEDVICNFFEEEIDPTRLEQMCNKARSYNNYLRQTVSRSAQKRWKYDDQIVKGRNTEKTEQSVDIVGPETFDAIDTFEVPEVSEISKLKVI